MSNTETTFIEIRKYLTAWVTEVTIANASSYFDINKISENTASTLLNLIYNAEFQNLNDSKINFPGIDLGDFKKTKTAFQITSRADNSKILSSLKSFKENNYSFEYPNGLRFLVINNKKIKRTASAKFAEFNDMFSFKTDIIYPSDLQKEIEKIYYNDYRQFENIRQFLKFEFGMLEDLREDGIQLLKFNSSVETVVFYKKMLNGIHGQAIHRFVHFNCVINNESVSTAELTDRILNNKGAIILGPSGCGKSILSKRIGLKFLERGITVILEGKYYDTDLNALFEKEICVLGFNSANDFFEASKKLQSEILFIIDGFNECPPSKKTKLLLEITKIKADHKAIIIISSQVAEALFEPLGLALVNVSYPTSKTKEEIAAIYSGKPPKSKLSSLLNSVSSAMEAKIIGEIAIVEIENVSRFDLFAVFFKQKLKTSKHHCFILLARIAQILSDNLGFSLRERAVEDILIEKQLDPLTYEHCIESKILVRNLDKISFTHEMLLNFFVVESIVRFSKDITSIVAQFNSPRNVDKRILILGSVSEPQLLEAILTGISDVELLNLLSNGDAGTYCKEWVLRKLHETIASLEKEIDQIDYKLNPKEINGVGFDKNTLLDWTDEQYALIHLLPFKFILGEYLLETFALIRKLDAKINQARLRIWEEAKSKDIHVKDGIFHVSYIGMSNDISGISNIFSSLRSGIVRYREEVKISKEIIEELLGSKSLTHGQFYFILELIRWDEKLQLLYPYAITALEKNWRTLPYHLLLRILDGVGHFHKNEIERQRMIDALNIIHSETKNIWLSTSLFDALSQIGALENDVVNHLPVVEDQLKKMLEDINAEENWQEANAIYNCQFDHPYSNAYHLAISNLDDNQRQQFFLMAFRGITSTFFGISLLSEASEILGKDICPWVEKWLDEPLFDKTTPQDSLRMFLLAHLLHAKHKYPFVSRFDSAKSESVKSLLAAGELYYWINRTDLVYTQIKLESEAARKVFFDPSNAFTVDTISECRQNILQSGTLRILEDQPIIFIEDFFRDLVVDVCRSTLRKLDWQKELPGISFGSNVNIHAISILRRYGTLIDIEILRDLAETSEYGEDAVQAIKELNRKTL